MGWMEQAERFAKGAFRIIDGMAQQANRQAGRAELQMARRGKLYDGLTMAEWERRWEDIGTIDDQRWRGIHDAGLYNIGPGLYIGRGSTTQDRLACIGAYNSISRGATREPTPKPHARYMAAREQRVS